MSKARRSNNVLLYITITSLIVALAMYVLNIESGRKIAYYESPRGILDRILNKSLEADYNNILKTHYYRFIVGLISVILFLGSLGLYVSKHRRVETGYF